MRSIRRSLLGYLLVLLALALSAVGGLVDRFANAAVRNREASEAGRIEQGFKLSEQKAKGRAEEARRKFDADLLAEAKVLSKEVQYKLAAILGQNERRLTVTEWQAIQAGASIAAATFGPWPGPGPGAGPRPLGGGGGGGGGGGRFVDPPAPVKAPEEEARAFRLRVALLEAAAAPDPLATWVLISALEPRAAGGASSSDPRVFNDPRRYNPFPGWIEYDGPRALARIAEALGKAFEDDDHPGGFQIALAGGPFRRPAQFVTVAYPARIGNARVELPVDPEWLHADRETEPKIDEVETPEGTLRRVTSATSPNGRSMLFDVWLAPPPVLTAAPVQFRAVPRGPHLSLRVVVQLARAPVIPNDGLAAARAAHDAELDRVRSETQLELAQLRARLVTIGAATFAALVLGGWFIVARGLSPLRTLSDAVSRVSERDFRLPVGPEELGRELAPIHARITQTLTLLQRAFAREKQAVADISHELRTPIASLLATIDVTLRKPRSPEQYRTALEECRLISRQLGQLVERIMTLASLDAGNDHTQVVRTDAGELARGCAAVIRPLAAANDVTLTVRVDDEVRLDTDAGKLREVLMNLLHNAVEYNRPDGTIELVARRDGPAAVFEVCDTGIGMAADVRERIFERFYRADSSRTATGVHAGLGLAIVKEYMARLKGTITVESEPGVGTTFRVTLPASPDESATPDHVLARAAAAAAP
ncbi:putative sensor histidine kinase TcrY [Gemmata obscuriglobus]|uniref:histidine kinase n=1 Tax=Gemmata obscuriglobus TaxID=114 RepID=A0A2Z3GXS8_9BACT|nr:HAMP domain-containing sensor histidine kinase [Gemmata obscuriglobus]AWM39289.1 sensor histidine kinase [Gemmata obscuriglobus]QEG27650.1 putative sensor histidine kinase TcrY [Gemmata obscuriglobus]VTS04823.1 integral membrane sensor signal transduction histidine kinase : Histidine kinase OS=Thermodesulfovibrio yellowstonii (strain ATCC 51303 / DSM 11347 / YP87) GN=THEYE_A0751 PE=4 SV=1: HAMP: HisKA: HATPase_c [Gemmata obscuriglobus UQM 2246]